MSLLLLSDSSSPATIAPKASGLGWSGVTGALGFRITAARNSLVLGGIAFDDAALGSVITMDATTRVETVHSTSSLVAGDFDFSDLDDWFIRLDGERFSASVRGTVEQASGVEAIKLSPKLDMAAFAQPDTVFRGFRFTFKLAPSALGGVAATTRIVVPGMESEVWSWNDEALAGAGMRWCVPGQVFAGGEDSSDPFGDTSHLPYDDPSGELAFDAPATTPEVYAFNNAPEDPANKTGLCFRFADHLSGAARIVRLARDGAGVMTFEFTFIAKDCSIGINGNSDTDFADGIQLRPMVGDDFDLFKWTAAREHAEGWDWTLHGKIGANSKLSGLAESLIVLGYASGGDQLASFDAYRTAFARLKTRLGAGADQMAVQVYDFGAGDPGTSAPVAAPFKATAVDAIKGMSDDGLNPILYEDGAEPTVSGLDVDLLVNDHVARTRLGYTIPGYGDLGDLPISGEGPSIDTGSDEGDVHYGLTYLNAPANAEYSAVIEGEHAELSNKKRGAYDDTRGLRAPQANDDHRLNPEDRGPGSTTFIPAVRGFIDARRAAAASAGVVDPAHFSEFLNGYSVVGRSDLAYSNPIYPPAGNFYGRTCLSPSRKFGQHIRIGTYLQWPSGPGPEWSAYSQAGWATPSELFHATLARWFFAGIAAPFQYLFTPSRPIGFVRTEEENGYQEYLDEAQFYDFAKRLYLAYPELTIALQTRATRMRELSSSMTRRALDYMLDGVSPIVAEAKLASGIWHLATEDCCVGVWANWSRLDGNPRTIEITDRIDVAGWPEMGGSQRDAYLVDFAKRETTQIKGWGGSSYSFADIDVEPGDVKAVFFVPAGDEPPFAPYVRPDPITSTGTANAPLVSTGAISSGLVSTGSI